MTVLSVGGAPTTARGGSVNMMESGTARLLFFHVWESCRVPPSKEAFERGFVQSGSRTVNVPRQEDRGIAALKRCVVDLGNATVIKRNAGRGEIQIAKRGRSTGRDENAFKRFGARGRSRPLHPREIPACCDV